MNEDEIRRKNRAINAANSAANDVFAYEKMECFGEEIQVCILLIDLVESLGLSKEIAAYIQQSVDFFDLKLNKPFLEQCEKVLKDSLEKKESKEDMCQSIDIYVFGESSLLGPEWKAELWEKYNR